MSGVTTSSPDPFKAFSPNRMVGAFFIRNFPWTPYLNQRREGRVGGSGRRRGKPAAFNGPIQAQISVEAPAQARRTLRLNRMIGSHD
jgi:hypothetical protein